MKLISSKELVKKAVEISKLKTQYLQGGYGCRLGKDWYDKNYSWNKANKSLIESKYNTTPITYGFDCVCLIKSIMWNFNGDGTKPFGNAVYSKETDYSVTKMYESCPIISKDFNNIEAGEFVFLGKNHIGIYIGNGEVIESTPAWKCCVQRTLLPSRNTTNFEKLPVRSWDCHGKSSLVDFSLIDYKSAYENLSNKYGELEQKIFHLNGKLKKILEVIQNEN